MSKYAHRLAIIALLCLIGVFSAATVMASSYQDRLYDDYGIELNGFVEVRQGWRLQEDPYEKGTSLSEGRLQLDVGKDFESATLKIKGDLTGDLVEEEGRAELREFNLAFSPLDMMDIKIGRQTLTWGTGDLLFINDLFPKDWKAFFIGRDDEYLKAPADAVKISVFSDFANLDLIYAPLFNGSEYIDGSRLSYWNAVIGRTAGRDFIFGDLEQNSFFEDSEIALRLSKTTASTELAMYGYYGFWKTPEGIDPTAVRLIYPRLAVYGASARTPLGGGIGNIEIGYYDSRDDPEGSDPFTRNSEFRLLGGFERELGKNLTAGFQYYLEGMLDYDAYEQNLTGGPKKDQYRHLMTLRLTKFLLNQNLRLSLFSYYSPSDNDAYLRPKAHYKVTDRWAVEVGGNIFLGADDHTFFGQFQNNTNAYAGLRYGF